MDESKDRENPREIVIRPRNEGERTRAAALTLALFWGLALVSVFIPFANLVLTPTLFILGPFAAWRASQRSRSAYNDVQPENHASTTDYPDEPPEPHAVSPLRQDGAVDDRRHIG